MWHMAKGDDKTYLNPFSSHPHDVKSIAEHEKSW